MKATPSFLEDLELIRRARQGHLLSRERLAARLRCVASFVAARNAALGGPLSWDEVDDLIQDVAAAVWKKIAQYRGEAPLEGWIYRFCILETGAFLRRKNSRESRRREWSERSGGTAAVQEPCGDLYEDVYSGLDKIDSDQAHVIRLKHFGQLTFEEISRRLKISTNTAKTRYYRGLIRLREFIDPQRLEEGS